MQLCNLQALWYPMFLGPEVILVQLMAHFEGKPEFIRADKPKFGVKKESTPEKSRSRSCLPENSQITHLYLRI